METTLLTTIVSTSGAVITGIFGMFFAANNLGDELTTRPTNWAIGLTICAATLENFVRNSMPSKM